MTCTQVAELVDAFVDAELPAPMLLEVARHAGGCASCEGKMSELAALHQAIERAVNLEVAGLPLSQVWPAVAQRIEGSEAQRRWQRRLGALRAPLWGAAAMALAAGTVLWLRTPEPHPARTPTRLATRYLPNQTYIDRLDTSGARLGVRREPKAGTTIIWVSAEGSENAP
jgi:anti-sigma factor RsiW